MRKPDFILKVYTEALKSAILEGQQPSFAVVQEIINIALSEGMKPPQTTPEYVQAVCDVYVDPDYNMWDEDVERNEKVMERYRRRLRSNR